MSDRKDERPGTRRIDGVLHLVREVRGEDGTVEYRVLAPLGVEFGLRDLAEIIVGATVLGIPVGYTEEVWVLGENLSVSHAIMICLASLIFAALFNYVTYYRDNSEGTTFDFVKRVVSSYLITVAVAATILFFVDKLPIVDKPWTAVRRTILVAFPATFSATVVDSLR